MPANGLIAIKCQVARGGQPDERVFRITLPDGIPYVGVVPRRYCFTRQGTSLSEGEPPAGKRADGLVSARVLREEDEGAFLISVPDGAVLLVYRDDVSPHPEEPAHRVLQQ